MKGLAIQKCIYCSEFLEMCCFDRSQGENLRGLSQGWRLLVLAAKMQYLVDKINHSGSACLKSTVCVHHTFMQEPD